MSSPQSGAPLFESLLGNWGGKVGIDFMYRNPDAPGSSHCDASAYVSEHTATTLSGFVGFIGTSINSDKQCGSGFSFTAAIKPDGTFTSLRVTDAHLGSHECIAVSDPTYRSGSASTSGFRIVLLDSAMCRWPALVDDRFAQAKETDRTFTVVADLRRAPLVPQ